MVELGVPVVPTLSNRVVIFYMQFVMAHLAHHKNKQTAYAFVLY